MAVVVVVIVNIHGVIQDIILVMDMLQFQLYNFIYINKMNNVIYTPKYIWGEYIWGYLHTISLIDNEFNNLKLVNEKTHKVIEIIKYLHLVLPCIKCAEHYKKWYDNLDKNHIYKSCELFYKTVDLHNEVNVFLEKPEISYENALMIWGKPM
jgi:hypothetical protein